MTVAATTFHGMPLRVGKVPSLQLASFRQLAHRFVPIVAADPRLYTPIARSWWPAHEIGHFLVATRAEAHAPLFGIDDYESPDCTEERYRYVVAKEIAATSISQHLLRRSGHDDLADEEIQLTDDSVLECSWERWCRRSVRQILREHRVECLPSTLIGIERLLTRKTHAIGAS